MQAIKEIETCQDIAKCINLVYISALYIYMIPNYSWRQQRRKITHFVQFVPDIVLIDFNLG